MSDLDKKFNHPVSESDYAEIKAQTQASAAAGA